MDKQDLLELLEYNRWAKHRLLDSLDSMKQEDFNKDLRSSHGGIRGTLYHMVNAENIWSSRLEGRPITPLVLDELNDVAAFRVKWDESDARLESIIRSSSDEQMHSTFDYQDSKGNKYTQPRIWAVSQLFNHFTYHRGQIVAMQRQLGYKPVNTDLIGFYRQKGS